MATAKNRFTALPLTEERCITPDQPIGNVVILIGSPGSGKSAITRMGLLNVDNIDHVTPDKWVEILARHRKADLSDPRQTAGLHLHVSPLYRKHKETSISLSARSNFVFETTGKRLEGLKHIISISRQANMRVVLVYVSVSLKTAHHGNSSRSRRVPRHVVGISHDAAETNFNAAIPLADEAWKVDNDTRPGYTQVRTSAFIKRIK